VPCGVPVVFDICTENCLLLENISIMSVMFISSGVLYSLVATEVNHFVIYLLHLDYVSPRYMHFSV
jgi:hypothetical protein